MLSTPRRVAGQIKYRVALLRDRARFWLKVASKLVIKTNKRRWAKVARNPKPHWDERNQYIASLIPAGSSVIDLGCGPQTLRRHLAPGCTYQPCDVVKSTPDVIYCNFNDGVYPSVSMSYDYVVCSGVIEYVLDPLEFVRKNTRLGRQTILSYNPFNKDRGDSKVVRLECDWVNHLTREEMDALFVAAGVEAKVLRVAQVGDTAYTKPGETVYLLRPKTA